MRLQSADTSAEIEKMQMELLRQAGTERRARLMRSLSATTRRLSRQGLRQLHPALLAQELNLLFISNLYGSELANAARTRLLEATENPQMNEDIIAAIAPVVAAFEKLNIPYLIGGSVASSALGLPRSTLDADLVAEVQLEHVPLLMAELGQDYYLAPQAIEEAINRRSSFNVLHLATMAKVDIFVLKTDPFNQLAFARRQPAKLDAGNPKEYFLSTPEDIVLHKLAWYEAGGRVSERQWLDVIGLLKVRGNTLDRAYLDEWAGKLNLTALLTQAYQDAGL